MSYRINEGRLNLKVVVDRTIHVLTLEAWETGEPLNLTISRGMKQPQETLQDPITAPCRSPRLPTRMTTRAKRNKKAPGRAKLVNAAATRQQPQRHGRRV